MKFRKNWHGILFLIILFSLSLDTRSVSGQELFSISVEFQSRSGVDFQNLAAGAPGDGWLFYYPSNTTFQNPKLVIHFQKKDVNSPAEALVYQTPEGNDFIPISITDGNVRLQDNLQPVIILTAPDGWWQRDGHANYNLDIQVYGPIHAMWGAETWVEEINPGELAVQIQVRDEDSNGTPEWDLRQLVPEFAGRGYLSTNYMERKCSTANKADLGIFPQWPFITSASGYEQGVGIFRPPIVVNWEQGKITHFSEMVTARNQNCSYTLYSLAPLDASTINITNFEAPFAFYDLSGEGVGYPNLILRTQRIPPNDPWIVSTQEYETIRYSWELTPGDWLWDYKVGVLGFHPYTSQTSIAGGQHTIDAPAYEEFPGWVIEKPWPIVTFVDSENSPYRSSEGIYEWSPSAFGEEFFLGSTNEPDLTTLQSIREGLRGEYRIGEELPVRLYFSPIDQRLHLLHADGGLFNLGGGQTLKLHNIGSSATLNGWTREQETLDAEENPTTTILEQLYQLEDLLVYSSTDSLELRQVEVQPVLFEVSPPTDNATWNQFRDMINQYQPQGGRDPAQLQNWLDAFPGPRLQITNARIDVLSGYRGSYMIGITLDSGYQITTDEQFGLSIEGLVPGRYLITYAQGAFTIEEWTGPGFDLTLTTQPEDLKSLTSLYQVNLIAANKDFKDSTELEVVIKADCEGQSKELLRKSATIPGIGQKNWMVAWLPSKQSCQLFAALYDSTGNEVGSTSLEVLLSQDTASQEIILAGSSQSTPASIILGLLVTLGITTTWLYSRLRKQLNHTSGGR